MQTCQIIALIQQIRDNSTKSYKNIFIIPAISSANIFCKIFFPRLIWPLDRCHKCKATSYKFICWLVPEASKTSFSLSTLVYLVVSFLCNIVKLSKVSCLPIAAKSIGQLPRLYPLCFLQLVKKNCEYFYFSVSIFIFESL